MCDFGIRSGNVADQSICRIDLPAYDSEAFHQWREPVQEAVRKTKGQLNWERTKRQRDTLKR